MIVNKLKWISGNKAPEKVLLDLDDKMADFYGKMAKRQAYQVMIDEAHTSDGDPVNVLTTIIVDYIISEKFTNILEIGCGSGKIFKALKQKGYQGSYTGVEMAEPVIENNKLNLPEAEWVAGSVYEYCTDQQAFDCCIAFFVLEHLIYPEKALQKMLGTLKFNGNLLLVFPDFSFSGIFPSQKVGLKYGEGAKEKLKKLKFTDAIISFIEGRIVAHNLKEVNKYFGSFVINTNPFNLNKECKALTPDVDAVYISNRQEIELWAEKLEYKASYPNGVEGNMAFNPLMCITKTR